MITKTLFISFLFITLGVGPRYGCQTTYPGAVKPVKQKTLKLVAEYKNNLLEDLSSDGELMLFYQTSVPIRTYTLPLDDGPGKANQPNVYDDMLRVVERGSAREIRRIDAKFFPSSAQFVPGTQQVFYSELVEYPKARVLYKLWSLTSGKVLVCLEKQDLQNEAFSNITAINPQKAISALWQKSDGGDLLVTLTLPDCKRTIIGPVNPSETKVVSGRLLGSEGFSLSLGRDEVAYETRDGIVFVRDTATLKNVKEIKPPSGLSFGRNLLYTPDGKFLLIVASNTIFDKPETRRYLLFYDTKNYGILRRLDVTSWRPPVLRDDIAVNSNALGTAMAISPDGRLLAVGYTKEEKKAFSITEQAQVVLYDLTTGEEVARASHPAVKQKRNDPFAAKIGKLVFTPDGKHLLSSTHDTLVWEIVSEGR